MSREGRVRGRVCSFTRELPLQQQTITISVHQLVLPDQVRAILGVKLGVEVEPPPHDRPLLLLQVGLQAFDVGLEGFQRRRCGGEVVSAACSPRRLWGATEGSDTAQGVRL